MKLSIIINLLISFEIFYITFLCVYVCGFKSKENKYGKLSRTESKELNFENIGKHFPEIKSNSIDFRKINVRQCGTKSKSHYIVGGVETERNEFPFVVSLRYNGSLCCTATIINNWWIITAAHCFYGKNKQLRDIFKYTIITGAHSPTLDGEEYGVTQIIAHHKYNSYTFNSDIALIKVDRKMDFNDKVNAICLPTKLYHEPAGLLTVVGWGRLDSEYPMKPSPELRKVDLPIISDEQCANLMTSWHDYTSFLCTYSKYSAQGTCNGDSGGPGFQYHFGRAVLLGITSWMVGNCLIIFPSVFTQVSYYIDWIYENLNH